MISMNWKRMTSHLPLSALGRQTAAESSFAEHPPKIAKWGNFALTARADHDCLDNSTASKTPPGQTGQRLDSGRGV